MIIISIVFKRATAVFYLSLPFPIDITGMKAIEHPGNRLENIDGFRGVKIWMVIVGSISCEGLCPEKFLQEQGQTESLHCFLILLLPILC